MIVVWRRHVTTLLIRTAFVMVLLYFWLTTNKTIEKNCDSHLRIPTKCAKTPVCNCPSEVHSENASKFPTSSNFNHNRTNDLPWIYVVTPTKFRNEQLADLTRLSQTLQHIRNLHWIMVQDSKITLSTVKELLERSTIPHTYLAVSSTVRAGPYGTKGMSQRNLGLDWLYEQANSGKIEDSGILYFADDDNTYDVRLFNQHIRRVRAVGVWAVGLVGHALVEEPTVDHNGSVSFNVIYSKDRLFPVDMAAFAVHLSLLFATRPRFHDGCEAGKYEGCFLKQLGISTQELVPFGHLPDPKTGRKSLLVWHTSTENSYSKGSHRGYQV